MKTKKGPTEEERKRQTNALYAFYKQRADPNRRKLLAFEESLIEPGQYTPGPDKFDQFAEADRDPHESEINTDQPGFVKAAQKKLRKAKVEDKNKRKDIATIVAASIQQATLSIECTQIFMTAYRRLYELQVAGKTDGIKTVADKLIWILESEAVENLYAASARLDVLEGIREKLYSVATAQKEQIIGKTYVAPEYPDEESDMEPDLIVVSGTSASSEETTASPRETPTSSSSAAQAKKTTSTTKSDEPMTDEQYAAFLQREEYKTARRPSRMTRPPEILTASQFGKATDSYEVKSTRVKSLKPAEESDGNDTDDSSGSNPKRKKSRFGR